MCYSELGRLGQVKLDRMNEQMKQALNPKTAGPGPSRIADDPGTAVVRARRSAND
jgi:hypothetical protein